MRRRYDSTIKRYITETIAIADDFADSDHSQILNFGEAQRKAREPVIAKAGVTVGDAVDRYLHALEAEGRPAAAIRDAQYRDRAFIRPKLGTVELRALTADKLRRWRDELAKAPARLRTRPGSAQQYRELGPDDDAGRARRASVNRNWTLLRAALNRAFEDGLIDSDAPWRRIKPFRGVSKARIRFLSAAEVVRLDNAIDPDFRPLLRAAFATGARYGQLAKLKVADFDSVGTLRLSSRKGAGAEKVYRAHLSDEARALFVQLCSGRRGSDLIFVRPDGKAWAHAHQSLLMREASRRAGLSPPVSIYVCRHTFASLAIMAGAPLMVVAEALGHTSTRMVEMHYGHLAPSFSAQAIRDAAPRFGFEPDRRVVVPLAKSRP